MRRADRLFRIVQFLRRRRRAVTARTIADEFGICTRTVYRDIEDLAASGVPIQGAAGVGYVLDRSFDMPPVAFDVDELEAVALGIAMVRNWTDERFAARAAAAMDKISAVLPQPLQARLGQLVLLSQPSRAMPPWTVSFSALRDAILAHRRITFDYRDERGRGSRRTVRPLAMVFFGPVWLLTGWCEVRRAYRTFRLDRMQALQVLDERFDDEPDKSLAHYLATACD